MPTTGNPRWRHRLKHISCDVDEIAFPGPTETPPQDEEWCTVVVAGEPRRIRLHDYHEIYLVPGLYEQLFYDKLQCCAPARTVSLMADVLSEAELDLTNLRVLDLGAGNGMVGDELEPYKAEYIAGVDIIAEAKVATERDRDGVYDDYLVVDFTDLPEEVETKLRARRFNCLTTVAALGFGDIPPQAFIKAIDLVETPGWVAMTIKEEFLREQDMSGFSALVRQLCQREIIQVQAFRRFCHRLSITGSRLHYVAMVAQKLQDVPDDLFAE